MKVRINNRSGLLFWLLYALFIALMIWAFSGCSKRIHPADKKFSRESINLKNPGKMKIKHCEL